MTEFPSVLTTNEAASFLRLNVDVLRRLANEGSIPCRRIGKGPKPRYRFLRHVLEAWLQNTPEFVDPRKLKKQEAFHESL